MGDLARTYIKGQKSIKNAIDSSTTPQSWSLFFSKHLSLPPSVIQPEPMLFLHVWLFFLVFIAPVISMPAGISGFGNGITIDRLNAVAPEQIVSGAVIPWVAYGFWTPVPGHNVSGTQTSQSDLSYITHLTVRKFSGPA